MQNRYAGDAGDFGKLALLKAFAEHMSVGLNWYLVDLPAERTNDGRHIGYLDRPHSDLFRCDPQLARRLKEIVMGARTVLQLQKILPNVTCYNAPLDSENRSRWHENAVTMLKECDLVFLDPDNGLLVPSVKRNMTRSVKYVFEEEIARYYSEGCSLFFYNHRSREPREKYLARLGRLYENHAFEGAVTFTLSYSAYSARDYIFIVQPRHSRIVAGITAAFMDSNWQGFFRLSSPPSRFSCSCPGKLAAWSSF